MNCFLCHAEGNAHPRSHEVVVRRGESVFFAREVFTSCDACGMSYITPDQSVVNLAAIEAPHLPPPPEEDE